jgi:hypothetical protein
MKSTINGVIMTDTISKELSALQNGYVMAIAEGLDGVIGLLLENSDNIDVEGRRLMGYLSTLHNARIELRALVPTEKGGEV